MLLKVENLQANIFEKPVLKGVNLQIERGSVHAIMGPNGSGKSSLAKALTGHPSCEVTGGQAKFEVNFMEKDLLAMDPAERSREGLFLSYQYPVEIPGVSNLNFLHKSFNSICKHQGVEEMGEEAFRKLAEKKAKEIELNPSFLDRSVNSGFSGGEKKKNEILQMSILSPQLAILDETDSGLDIDALKVVAGGINKFRNKNNAVILITHYQRLLDYVKPDFVHIFYAGQIIESGGPELALKLESQGYDFLRGNVQ